MMLDMPSVPADLHPDSDVAPLHWLLRELEAGRSGALLTVTAVHGGAPRPVGTHMAVVSGTRFAGHLSGGCVESAIACEVAGVIAGGRSRVLRFGQGSPIFDIRFPCGGGMDVLVSVGLSADLIREALERHAQRRPLGLAFAPETEEMAIIDPAGQDGWIGGTFQRTYRPPTRLCLAGRGPELEAMVRLGFASGFDIQVATPDADQTQRLARLATDTRHLRSTTDPWPHQADPWTATVLLFHEREWEETILAEALPGPGFYLGALGSQRTQAARRERLLAQGHPRALVERLKGPIGIIPQARDPATLALSVLGEIAVARRQADMNVTHG